MKTATIEQQKQALAEAFQQVEALEKAKEIARLELETNLIDGSPDVLDELERAFVAAQAALARGVARCSALSHRIAGDEVAARLSAATEHLVMASNLEDEIQKKINAFNDLAAKLEPLSKEIYSLTPKLREHLVLAKGLGARVHSPIFKAPVPESAWLSLKSVGNINQHAFIAG